MLVKVIDILTILVALSPVFIQLFNLLAQKANNQKIANLSERASIIVTALEQTALSNPDKKLAAMNKLTRYAKEVGISVSYDQVDDYVESAVKLLKLLSK